MSLEQYARKRHFKKTPEPPPKLAAPSPGNLYCIQRHMARRLHYDLRLEVGGTLKSWAVPHGPTLDPAEKRLAVMVEDHPIEYGSFEGNIPANNYGAGSVMLWDSGRWELLGDTAVEAQIERGDFKFRLHGEKLQGDFALVRMKNRGKGNEWLLLKKKDPSARPGWDVEQHAFSVATGRTQEEIAHDMPARGASIAKAAAADPSRIAGAAQAEMPLTIPPMQAFAADKPPAEKGWLYEIKWDGVRAIAFVDGGQSRFVSRKGTSIDRQYPELSVLPHYVTAKRAIFDGEIAAVDEKGRPSFQRIQPRIMASDPNAIGHLARSNPVVYFIFDLLYLDGYDLRAVPLSERKSLLAAVLKSGTQIKLSEHFEDKGVELLEAARAQELEGIVAKRAASRYEGRRSKEWLKLKVTTDDEFVLCGYTKGERDFFGAIVLGYFEKGKLKWAGNVGTGFDRKQMEAIHKLLEQRRTDKMPFETEPEIPQPVTWVRPELVATVRFHSFTGEGRLRAPVWVGLRPDAEPRDCSQEKQEEPAERPPLLEPKKEEVKLTIDKRPLSFTHLNKLMYPADGYTKRDIINYYDAVADLLIPHLRDRPLSLKRYVNGIGEEHFFQKDASKGFPSWFRTELVQEDEETKQYAVCDDRASLLYLANLNCIDQNPWMSRVGSLEHPDFILIDLDPQECGYDKIVEAAQLVRRMLGMIGLSGFPKTTGGDGMHIYIPLEPVYAYDQAKAFAEIISRLVAAERPDLFTTPRTVSRREKNKVYFDHLQIGMGKTISAPYVVRAYPGAPVATPLDWNEVARGLTPQQFHIRNAPERFARVGDLFAAVLTTRQRLEPAMEKLGGIIRK